MTTLTEARRNGSFIMTEANGNRSRESATVASGQTLDAGEVVMLSGANLVAWDGGTDSVAIGIIIHKVDASAAAVERCAYIARDAEVNGDELTYPVGTLAGATADLKDLGIIVR